MIAHFPEAYPDELVYSILARYYMKTGYVNFIRVAEDLFLRKTIAPSVESMNEYREEVKHFLTGDGTMEDLVMQHTMFPEFGRFNGAERRKRALAGVAAGDPESKYLVTVPVNKTGRPRYVRYCPECARKDRELYGETYWHRIPQIIGLEVCPVHACKLVETDIEVRRADHPNLIAAEERIPLDACGEEGSDGLSLYLARYMADVFQSPVPMDNEIPVGDYLDFRLNGTKYKSVSGRSRHMKTLFGDFSQFYAGKDVSLKERWQLSHVFDGDRHTFSEVCQLAFFLQISAQDLAALQPPEKSLHNGHIIRKPARYYSHGTGKRREKNEWSLHDWTALDQRMLPKVKAAIAEMEAADEKQRPRRITVHGVAVQAGINNDWLAKKLPSCLEEVRRCMVPREEYWAKETVWALHQLQSSGNAINWKHIRELTGMKPPALHRCMPYLSKYATVEEMDLLVRNGVIPDWIQEE